jgi:spore coat polysaccharide biosynthesis protein SpsF (cytidylyltransferase family)
MIQQEKKVVAVVAVRMGSERLPGKVMKEIQGRPMIGYLHERLSGSRLVDEIVIATSGNQENDIIARFCAQNEILCFRGSENDVLDRLVRALEWRKASTGVVVFGDNPLIDPDIVDELIGRFQCMENYEFVGNDLKTTYPPGMEVEVFDPNALIRADSMAGNEDIRQHGTLYMRANPESFKIRNIEAPEGIIGAGVYLGVDSLEDFLVVKKITCNFGSRRDYALTEIIEFLSANPEIAEINQGVPRRWRKYRTDGQ